MTILESLLHGIAAVLSSLALTVGAQAERPWQRQPEETCASYLSRLEANNFELWRANWCGDGPCYRVIVIQGQGQKTAEGFTLHPYFAEQRHGCFGP